MANPQALVVATSAAQAVERIGLPESQLILAHAAVCVAVSPKSNSCTEAIFAAREAIRSGTYTIPPYLQDAHYKGARGLGRGIGYMYAHEYEDHYAGQPMLPEAVRGEKFYRPSENGYEKQIREHMTSLTKDSRYTDPEELLPRTGGPSD